MARFPLPIRIGFFPTEVRVLKILVLMSAYNGEAYIRQQIDSVLAQDIDAQLQLLIRDDGSTDATQAIVQEYQAAGKLSWYAGENLGPERSFWHLIQTAPEADFYALCDQDDVWLPDKLSRAVKQLGKAQADLYCSAFIATDADLNPIEHYHSPLNQYTDYAHSLIYSTAAGCTFVFTHKARTAAMAYDMERHPAIIHDWLLHKIVTITGGKMIFDPVGSIYYRQHGHNTIGAQKNGLQGLAVRVKRFLCGGSRGVRSGCAKALLDVYGDRVESEVREALDLVANYAEDPRKRKKFLRDPRFRTGTVNDLLLRCLVYLKAL